jgi:hypothetical protein
MGVSDISGAGLTRSRALEHVQSDDTFEFQQATTISTSTGDLTLNASSNAIAVRSGSSSTASKISMGTDVNKSTIGCSGGTDTFFTGTAAGDLVVRADDNNNKVHIGAGTSGIAGMVVTEVANVGKVGVGTATPGAQLDVRDTTTSSANTGGHIRLSADDGAAMGDSHRLGVIDFTGAEDAGGSQTVGARIEVMTDAAWSASENGAAFYFYTTDGNASQSSVLKLDSNKKATFSGVVDVAGTAPDVTLRNSTSENTAGGCESKVIFEDHGANALGQIEVSHVGTSDDEKGQLVISTNNDSGLQTALTIDEDQTATFAGNVTCGVDDTGVDVRLFSATASEGVLYDASEDELALLLTTKLKFHDVGGGEEIYASSNGHLEINAGTTVDISSGSMIDLNASVITIDGTLTPREKMVIDIPSRSGTPGTDGSMFHIEGGATFTDENTSGSGTAAIFNMMDIETTTLAASNSSVTTTNASTLYISGAPAAGTNQTLTNSWALWANGSSRVSGDLFVDSSTSGVPTITIQNTNADADAGAVKFIKNGTSSANDDALGDIIWKGEDAAGNEDLFAKIAVTVKDVTSGSEVGAMDFVLHDGDGTPSSAFDINLTTENVCTFHQATIAPRASAYKTSAYAMDSTTDSFVLVSTSGGVVTITLPNAVAADNGKVYTIKDNGNANSNNITVAATSGDFIEGTEEEGGGEANQTISTAKASLSFILRWVSGGGSPGGYYWLI